MNEAIAARRTGTSSSRSSATTTESYTARLGLRVLQERRHRLLGRPRRAQPAQGRARRRSITPSCAEHVAGRRLGQAVAEDPRAQRRLVGQHDLVQVRARAGRERAAHARPRHRLGRGARQLDARLRGRLARADLRSREQRLHRDHRGRRQADQVGERDAGQPPASRRRADAPRGDDVRDPRRDARSPRGVQGPADASDVAQLRAARRRRSAAGSSALEDLGDEVAGAAQPARGAADDAARRRARRHRRDHAGGLHRQRHRTRRAHRPAGARGERGGRAARRCPTRCGSTIASRDPRASCKAQRLQDR